MITQRTSQEVTQQEEEVFAKVCSDRGVVMHGAARETNALEIGAFLIEQWQVIINEESMNAAIDKLGEAHRITFYTPIEARYFRIAAEDTDRAKTLNKWVQSSANRSLVKTGEENLANQAALLAELRGRELSASEIQNAIGRCSARGGLHFAPAERKVDPRQHKSSDEPFLPKATDRSVVGGRKNHAFTEPEAARPAATKSTDAWQQLAEGLLYEGTHSQQAAMKEIFEQGRNQRKSYREIYSQMKSLKSQYEKLFSPRGV